MRRLAQGKRGSNWLRSSLAANVVLVVSLLLALLGASVARADVPPGFTDVEVSLCQPSGSLSQTVVNLWGREYVLDGAGLPIQIRSQDQDLLDSPLRMVFDYDPDGEGGSGAGTYAIVAGATPFAQFGSGDPCPLRLEEDERGVTFYNALWEMDALVQIQTRIEYDGMIRVNLDLTVFDPDYDLRSFHYQLDVPAAIAKLYHHHVQYDFQELNIDKDKYVASSGKIPTSGSLLPMRLPFVPTFFVGNDEVGLEWWTETNGSLPPGPPYPAPGSLDPAMWTNTWSDDVEETDDPVPDPEPEATLARKNPISLSREQGVSGQVVRLRIAPLPGPLERPWSRPRPVRVTTPDTDAPLPGSEPGPWFFTFHHEFALFATPMREEGLFPASGNAPDHPHRTTRYSVSPSFTGQLRMDTVNRYYAILFLDRSHPKNTGLPEPEIVHACDPAAGGHYPESALPPGGSTEWADPGDCPSLGTTHAQVVETFHALPDAQRPRMIHYSAMARAPGLGHGDVNAQVGIDPDPASAFHEDDSFTKFTWSNRLRGRGDIRGAGADGPAIRRWGFYPGVRPPNPPIPGNLGSDWSYFPCFDESEVADVVLEPGGSAVSLSFGEYLLDRVLHGLRGVVQGNDGMAFPVSVGGLEETVPRRGLDGLYFDFGNLSRHCAKRAIDYWHDWPARIDLQDRASTIRGDRSGTTSRSESSTSPCTRA